MPQSNEVNTVTLSNGSYDSMRNTNERAGIFVKVKGSMFFRYSIENKCWVRLCPNQKWKLIGSKDGIYIIMRKGIMITIGKEDFDEKFKEYHEIQN